MGNEQRKADLWDGLAKLISGAISVRVSLTARGDAACKDIMLNLPPDLFSS